MLELVAALALLGLGVAELLPLARRQMDRMAVVAAREAVVGLFHRARMEAVARGGATLLLCAEPPRAELRVGDEVLDAEDLEGEYRVSLRLSRDRASRSLTFDALGLGRVASQSLAFRRGGEERRLLISSYGRVRRE